ncbi:hypothetical protein [Shewanella sedimentimangrovi]|uniref:Orphan protein n=1 Tax=Shewanella sedimentimangrovi TaxID=2814293 RepID=A0ABX7R677_9GAMM|nr:hypothetical protein [Shewanella sedimentimangrovi]QSX38650.1 hypothetical protein JYB85_07520 [Shewanella sedimentimangrovi]
MASPAVDIPFDKRYKCWFCEEPCRGLFDYPAPPFCPHPSLAVPACDECLKLARQQALTSIYECRLAVKDALMARYAKHLAIGSNWTREELEQSEFECKIFGGFKKSAWFMFEVARDRVNARGWPLALNGIPLDESGSDTRFTFDGLEFASVLAAVRHYVGIWSLDKQLLETLLGLVGHERFGYALRLCRLHLGSTPAMKQMLIRDVRAELGQA